MPYHNGYDVLPKLKPLTYPVFEPYDESFALAKKSEISKRKCYYRHNIEDSTVSEISKYILDSTGIVGDIAQQAELLREDIAIHRVEDDQDWLALVHVCFPAGWKPEEIIGKSFVDIHRPIPKMRLDNAHKLARAMVYSSPYERYVWTIAFDRRLSGYPDQDKVEFDIDNPMLLVKYERQCIIGFKHLKAALFTICQHYIEEKDIDKTALLRSLESMSEEHIKYKRLDRSYDSVIEYLKSIPRG